MALQPQEVPAVLLMALVFLFVLAVIGFSGAVLFQATSVDPNIISNRRIFAAVTFGAAILVLIMLIFYQIAVPLSRYFSPRSAAAPAPSSRAPLGVPSQYYQPRRPGEF